MIAIIVYKQNQQEALLLQGTVQRA